MRCIMVLMITCMTSAWLNLFSKKRNGIWLGKRIVLMMAISSTKDNAKVHMKSKCLLSFFPCNGMLYYTIYVLIMYHSMLVERGVGCIIDLVSQGICMISFSAHGSHEESAYSFTLSLYVLYTDAPWCLITVSGIGYFSFNSKVE